MMVDYEGMILARQDYQEIYEDETDSEFFEQFDEEYIEWLSEQYGRFAYE